MTGLELDVPETCGLLQKPPRKPPTAIGVAMLPPPPDAYSRRHTLTRRIALAFFAIALALVALPLASSERGGPTAFASSLAAVSVDAGLQAASGSVNPWREIVGPATLRLLQQTAALPAQFSARHARRRDNGALLHVGSLEARNHELPDESGGGV